MNVEQPGLTPVSIQDFVLCILQCAMTQHQSSVDFYKFHKFHKLCVSFHLNSIMLGNIYDFMSLNMCKVIYSTNF